MKTGRLIAIASLAAVFALSPTACRNGRDRSATAGKYESVLIEDVPHVAQKPDFCGEACAEMVLRRLGSDLDQDDVFEAAGVDPSLGRGAWAADLASGLGKLGFEVGDAWKRLDHGDATAEEREFAAMHADLVAGVPSIVCMRYDDSPSASEHFRLVLGYDAEKDEVVYHEPAAAAGGDYNRMPRTVFMKLWPLQGKDGDWFVIRLRMDADQMKKKPGKGKKPGKAKPTGPTTAQYAQHVIALKDEVPEGFSVVLAKPFVVIGEGPKSVVKKKDAALVSWAVSMLRQDWFDRDPDTIIDIWLFAGNESYMKHAKEIFGDTPTTPYGYYSDEHDALVMDIETGGGTLIHEIVHPYMDANFPKCPSWFNEGLGSLYEACEERDGHIAGLTNWRLPGLKDAIAEGTLPSLETLVSTTDSQFYGDESGTNYAQARYLLYYLQEQGLLLDYYKEFHKNTAEDPTGWDTLVSTLHEKDMKAFQKRWEKWVMDLEWKQPGG